MSKQASRWTRNTREDRENRNGLAGYQLPSATAYKPPRGVVGLHIPAPINQTDGSLMVPGA